MGFLIHSFCQGWHNKRSCISFPFQCLHHFLPFLLGQLGSLEEAPRGEAEGRWPDGGGRLISRSLGHVVHDQVARRAEAVPQSWFPAGKAAVPFPFCVTWECPCNPQNR